MSLLFNHGRRHDLCDRNPIEWVRQSGKRRTAPDILTTREVQQLLANLRFRERTLVLLAVTTGLRRSELFALKWKDVDFQANQIVDESPREETTLLLHIRRRLSAAGSKKSRRAHRGRPTVRTSQSSPLTQQLAGEQGESRTENRSGNPAS